MYLFVNGYNKAKNVNVSQRPDPVEDFKIEPFVPSILREQSSMSVIKTETPMPFQAIGEDGKLSEVMLSMPNGEVVKADADYIDDCPVPKSGAVITALGGENGEVKDVAVVDCPAPMGPQTTEIAAVVENAVAATPDEVISCNPMVAAMARANERRATQPQHANAAKASVRRRKMAEPK